MSILVALLIIAALAGGVTITAPRQGTIEAWASRTNPVPGQLPVRLPRTPRPETLVILSAPRIFPLVPANRYSETRVPVGYDTALTEWDLLVREMTGTPSLSEQSRTARYPSGMPVALP
jgi:hypothetical protein